MIHQKNQGVSAARNVGIEASRGEYLTFIDSDDYISCTFLGDAVNEIQKKKADLYLVGQTLVNDYGVVRVNVISEDYSISMPKVSECQMIDLLASNYIASSCGKVISRKLVGTTRFDCNMNFGEDLKFMHEIIGKPGMMHAAAKPYYCYWVQYTDGTHLSSLISEKKCMSVVKTYRVLFDMAKKWGKNGQYWQFVAKRWISDCGYIEHMIIDSPISLWKQHKMWRILLSDSELRKVLIENADKKYRIFLERPDLFLLKRYASRIKRKLINL